LRPYRDAVRPGLLVVALVAGSLTVAHAEVAFTRYLGGGNARTDCMLVTDVAGATGAHAARCRDGDPSCDADGVANGSCVFRVRVCLDATSAALPHCSADVVTAVVASVPAVEATLQALAMPVASPDTCAAEATVAVPRGRRIVLRASATMASGHADRDALPLVCRRPPPPATFATLERQVFAVSCSSVSCHGAADSGGLTLTTGSAYANLVGVPATNPAAHAAGLLRVVPGDPDASFLLDKLTGMLTPDEGDPMPRIGGPLPAARLDLIRRWIAAGAPADAPF
jgi:hypothetical protein